MCVQSISCSAWVKGQRKNDEDGEKRGNWTRKGKTNDF